MRYKSFVTRVKDEDGQAIVLVALAMSLFLLAAVGLAVDGSTLYTHRQMAQAAADAAAQAGIMSIFDGTNTLTGNAAAFTAGTAFTCTTTDSKTPCAYARLNGFGGSATDTVTVSFPANSTVPGVVFSPSATDPTSLIKVSVSRDVNTTLMRLLGSTVTTVRATAMAGIVDIIAPVPILITHPTLDGALSMNGTPTIQICGGPSRSIEVNSSSAIAESTGSNPTIDLSHAGPLDTLGTCTTGTGADFGVWGGPSPSPTFTFLPGTKPGKYLPKASPIQDPLKDVPAPPVPTTAGTQIPFAPTTTLQGQLCPASAAPHPCTLLTPGLFPTGINLTITTVFMEPGIYYIQTGGFTCGANCSIAMASPANADVTTGTGWDGTVAGGGVLVYNSGSGQINIGSNGSVDLTGSPAGSIYKNILFFEDHTASANTSAQHPKNPHSMGGGGSMILRGTIYLTNTLDIMNGTPAQYQELDLQGTPGNTTKIQGQIIVGALQLGGNAGITMNLNSSTTLVVRQVALVN
jgi:Flp pilus assembly protein TadG